MATMQQPQSSGPDRRFEVVSGVREPGLEAQIAELRLDEVQRTYLQERWLGQVRYLGKAARRAQRRYYALRLIAILGGVAIPALVGLNVGSDVEPYVHWLTFGLGLTVAAAVALEEFFRWGDQWRHYRLQTELLRGEGWNFLALAGDHYRRFKTHAEGFRTFVAHSEEAMRREVGIYVTEVARTSDDSREDRRPRPEPEPATRVTTEPVAPRT